MRRGIVNGFVGPIVLGLVLGASGVASAYPVSQHPFDAPEDMSPRRVNELEETVRRIVRSSSAAASALFPARPPSPAKPCPKPVGKACLAKLAKAIGPVLSGVLERGEGDAIVHLSLTDANGVSGPVSVHLDDQIDQDRRVLGAILSLVKSRKAAAEALAPPPEPRAATPPPAPTRAPEPPPPPPPMFATPAPPRPLIPAAPSPPLVFPSSASARPAPPSLPNGALQPTAPATAPGELPRGVWVLGAGAALLLAGGIAGLVDRGLADDLSSRYTAGTLTPDDAPRYVAVDVLNVVANTFFVAGGLAASTGLCLWTVVDAPPDPRRAPGVTLPRRL